MYDGVGCFCLFPKLCVYVEWAVSSVVLGSPRLVAVIHPLSLVVYPSSGGSYWYLHAGGPSATTCD